MKKYDEGYALPFVLIVMVIICLVGVSILSNSLRNLQNQQASIKRMQEQYEAEGKIIQVIGELQKQGTICQSTLDTICGEDVNYNETVEGNNDYSGIVDSYSDEGNGQSSLKVTFSAKQNDVTIITTIQFVGDIKENTLDLEKSYSFERDSLTYEYLSYQIETEV